MVRRKSARLMVVPFMRPEIRFFFGFVFLVLVSLLLGFSPIAAAMVFWLLHISVFFYSASPTIKIGGDPIADRER